MIFSDEKSLLINPIMPVLQKEIICYSINFIYGNVKEILPKLVKGKA